ncbi:MAG: C4-type zinc ribbon domain-containing protein [Chloroflexota bacterium]
MSLSLSLFRLQQTDNQLDRIRSRLDTIQELLEDDEILQKKVIHLDDAQLKADNAKKALASAETNVNAQILKIEQAETSLYSGTIKNPKELQDAQHELSSLKRYLITLEDRQLDAMSTSEDATSDVQLAQEDLLIVQKGMQEQAQVLSKEQLELRREYDRFSAERTAIINSIPEEFIGQYENLREKRKGVAVANITDNACDACGNTLTPALVQTVRSARSADHIAECPACGRILYAS